MGNGFHYLAILILIGCTSRSVTDERFHESSVLSNPNIEVTLSDPRTFSFAIVGDLHISNQDTSRFGRILTQASTEGDSFVILLGDIVDKGERADILAVRSLLASGGWNGKFLSVIGNHDIFNSGWAHYKDLNGGTHYSVQIGNSRFIALDTADGNIGKEQSDWLKLELEKVRPENTFLLSHYLPVIPTQRTYLKLANELEAIRTMKLASNHHVTAWLGAHYHSYIVENIEGVTYVVAGGGGGRRMEPVKDFFFVQVQVSGNRVSYHLKKVD